MIAGLTKKGTRFLAATLICCGGAFGASAQTAPAEPLKVATLVPDGIVVSAGDLLRTTRIFPNWNLNCEVLLSQGRHLCAVELRSVDTQGRQVLAWSIALATNGEPIMVLKTAADIDQTYGLRMVIGPYTTVLTPRKEDCTKIECRILAPFETTLRTLIVSQKQVGFSVMRNNVVLQVDAPLAGMSEALDMARRDPIGLIATQQSQRPTASLKTPPKRTAAAKPAAAKKMAVSEAATVR